MGRHICSEQRERFCRAIVLEGKQPREAYIACGFGASGADYRNHNRLMRDPRIKARIEELTRARDAAVRASRMPLPDVLIELGKHGIDRISDLFETGSSGEMAVRDLRGIGGDITLALLRALHDGTGMAWDEHQCSAGTPNRGEVKIIPPST